MKSPLVHVARDGKILGQYPAGEIPSLLDTGALAETDLCYTDTTADWLPMPEFLATQTPARAFTEAKSDPGSADRPRRGSSRRSSRKKGNAALVASWIAFLMAIAALVGAGFWIAALYDEIARKSTEIESLTSEVATREKENQRLLFAAREIAEPGTVRASLVIRDANGKRVALPGIRASLYTRDTIEKFLDQRFAAAAGMPPDSPQDVVKFLSEGLPSPLATTSTDASGRIEFPVAEPGEYVIAMTASPPGAGPRIWFASFDSRDTLNSIVELSDSNAVRQFVRSLVIVQGR